MKLVQEEQPEITKLENLSYTDPGFSLKILRLANMPYLNTGQKVADIAKAFRLLNSLTDVTILSRCIKTAARHATVREASWQEYREYLQRFQHYAEKIRQKLFAQELEPGPLATAVLISESGLFCWAGGHTSHGNECLGPGEVNALAAPQEPQHSAVSHYLCQLWNFPQGLAEIAAVHLQPWQVHPSRRPLVLCLYLAEGLTRHSFAPQRPLEEFLEADILEITGLEGGDLAQLRLE